MNEADAGIDDRTSRFLSLFVPATVEARRFPFQSLEVHLGIAPDWAHTSTGQTLLLTTANLLGRFVGRIDLDVPAIGVLSPLGSGRTDLLGETEHMAHQARARSGETARADSARVVVPSVQIGEGGARSGFQVGLSAHGWRAELDLRHPRPPEGPEDSNPFGALVAATLGVAEIFKEILRSVGSAQRSVRNATGTFSFSALDFSTGHTDAAGPTPSADSLTASLIGAGAVANSLAFALGAIDTRHASIRVIDPDRLDVSNLNRHLLSTLQDIGRPKAEVVADFLRGHGVSATPSIAKYQDIRSVLTKDEVRLVVSTVDNDEARLALQSDLPRQLLHGATDGDVAVVSRHGFIDGACLGCLFYEQPRSYAESVTDDTGLPLDEVVRLLETHGVLTGRHVDVIARKNGPQFDRLRADIGRSFEEVYATQICGVMNVSIGEQRFSPTVSFVSALPGFLLAAELLKCTSPELERYQLKNYLALSLFAPSYRQVLYRPKDNRCRCFCADPIMRSSYFRRWD